MLDDIYKLFCRETKCIYYDLISRLESMPRTPQTEKQLETAGVHCAQACERTAAQFYQWMLEKNITRWIRGK
jgi:hypothetical protein